MTFSDFNSTLNGSQTGDTGAQQTARSSSSRKGARTLGVATVAGLALFAVSTLSGGSSASAAPGAGMPALPPGCVTVFNCPQPPVSDPPPPTPTCSTIVCQVVGDLDDLEVYPADPVPTPCPTVVACVDVVGPVDGGVLEPSDPTPPTATPEPPTPEPTQTPEPATPEPTPSPTQEPAPTNVPAAEPTPVTGGNTQPSNDTPQAPAAPAQGVQQGESAPQTVSSESKPGEQKGTGEGAKNDDATEDQAGADVLVTSADNGGLSLLSVALVAIGVAVPASGAAYFLARRQKAA